jgi:hypothetical protein
MWKGMTPYLLSWSIDGSLRVHRCNTGIDNAEIRGSVDHEFGGGNSVNGTESYGSGPKRVLPRFESNPEVALRAGIGSVRRWRVLERLHITGK